MHFEADAQLPSELERNMKNNEYIIRFLVIRKES